MSEVAVFGPREFAVDMPLYFHDLDRPLGQIPLDEQLDALALLERMRAYLDAQQQKLLAAITAHAPTAGETDKHWVHEEIACALRMAPRSATARIHAAEQLVRRFPATLAALEDGELTLSHTQVLIEAAAGLPEPAAARVEAHALTKAAGRSLPEFRRAVTRAVLAADPRSADQRRFDALTGLALHALDGCAAGDLRVAERHGRKPAVQVTVAVSTLLGLDDQPGELTGHGPVPATVARHLAADPSGTWRRLLTDDRGRLLDYGRSTYRPPQDLVDHVTARDPYCRFPHCHHPAARCDLDHRTAWADNGSTSADNLDPLNPRHHTMKHEAGWAPELLPDGTMQWTSPTGHVYYDPPHLHPADHTYELLATHADDPPPF
jgi:hypothetical protein